MYSFTIDHVHYDRYRDGTPFTLADCLREVRGVGGARIWCGDRLVLDRAGEVVGRRYAIARRYKLAREAQRERSRQAVATLVDGLERASGRAA